MRAKRPVLQSHHELMTGCRDLTHLVEQVAEHALGLSSGFVSSICGIVHSSLALVLGLPSLALSLRCTLSQCLASLIDCLLTLQLLR